MRSAFLALALLVAAAACDVAPTTTWRSSISIDADVTPDTLTAGVPFPVSVTGDSDPPAAAVRVLVFRGERSFDPFGVQDTLAALRLDLSAPISAFSADTTLTIPADAIARTQQVSLWVDLYTSAQGEERSQGGSGIRLVVRPAP